jgi:uncharacterized protein (TIGR02118 family)
MLESPPARTNERCQTVIKVSVFYPNKPGARFDHTYYKDKHMPLVKTRMGAHCKYYTVDKGLAGGAPNTAPIYIAMCHIFCDSVESFQTGFGPHADEIMKDIPNYTDLEPVIQISDVVVGH